MSNKAVLAATALLTTIAACGDSSSSSTSSPTTVSSTTSEAPASPQPPSTAQPSSPTTPAPSAPPSLDVKWLGAQGFLLTVNGESVLTPPLYTRPNLVQVELGTAVVSDIELVKKKLDDKTLANVKAIVSGHAHYDHLLDVPNILGRAPAATLFANRSAKNLLAAYAPDRAAKCTDPKSTTVTIPRDRVVALDDSLASAIDWTNCAAKKPAGVPLEGKWVDVPGANIRLYGVCSEHPDQFGPIHFGEGDVEEEVCNPPSKMADWKEGLTIAFLIDFLDPTTKAPVQRIYYQDAPTNAPAGHVPAKVLAADGRPVDLALLCVGSSNNVEDEPNAILNALKPRHAIGGHWEDFFRSVDDPPKAITFLDVEKWLTQAKVALGPLSSSSSSAWKVNGKPASDRVVLPQPNDVFLLH